ncbi:T9SS type A sorting domain-containing protein [Algoriphagus machipongonensis]|uniref:Secretion system C-terminal sorting domain-containing protein n=1 Tax=Algoriphagus machipongonensis TaxID=388413 RepID=A3I358_9BACT|nr:T9SS type A sorting domain-containing protein [Algoriphagus machipongonensis]EAZ79257.1 hypothetical protein ALPR1_14339 [Algoriphagus machipongonensis]
MGNRLNIVCACFLFFNLGLILETHAQIVEFAPIHQIKTASNLDFKSNSRIFEGNTLPFWDDFSQGVDTLKWELSGVSYTETIGVNPPSIGQLLFNGVNENGKPYSLSERDNGITDQLTSKPFDLSQTNSNSLYLSFFWQPGGKAEYPDKNDQLSLQFLNEDGAWITIWHQLGGDTLDRTVFTQEIIQVNQEFQHEEFQFRFTAEGRQVGPFDSWLLDYIYLNEDRSEDDITYKDRSLTQSNLVSLGDYGAYPFELLNSQQTGQWDSVQNQFLNLEDRFRAMEYSILAKDTLSNSIVSINSNTPFNPVPNSRERRTFQSLNFEEVPNAEKATSIEFTTYLTTGDQELFSISNGDTTYYPEVDFRINDTVRTYFPIQDFFAYDHGSADYAAGINQKSGMLAVKYDTPTDVFLKGISINFTNANQANQAIDILVWEDLETEPIFRREDLIPVKDAGQEFLYYSLDTNIQVSGEFYVGFAQFTNDFIHVGLDKSVDHGDKLFYNIVGTWVENEEVSGSLMIRPHIALEAPYEETIAPEARIKIFPNPVTSFLHLEGRFGDLAIFDSFGREIFLEREQTEEGEIINFTGQRPGIYLVKVSSEAEQQTIRILVR